MLASVITRINHTYILFLAIPLVLSAFTHLWNPIGFPAVYIDEEHYMRRTMNVLNGHGPQEPTRFYTMQYDHPYFGQLFLAGLLRIIGYPSSLHPSAAAPDDLIDSIEMLHLVPRVLMSLLAVLDTFLIYKIAEVRYNNRKVAFIASILFAVMPLSWLTRRIYLENLQLPFLLLSILFAVYYAKKNSYSPSMLSSSTSSISTTKTTSSSLTTYEKNNNNNKKKKNKENKSKNKKNISLVILSGIFLGLAIFTKIPAFTMIPLVGFLIISAANENSNNKNNYVDNSTIGRRIKRRNIITNLRNLNLKALGLWFIPVILIPAIWPAYNVLTGQFNDWFHGVLGWEDRVNTRSILLTLNSIFRIDPVLLSLGAAGIIFATVIRKDFMFLLWTVPFIIYFAIVGYVKTYYWIPILPIFCISAAVLIEGLSDKISKIKKNSKKNIIIVSQKILLPYAIISVVGIFGLISTIMLITTNLNFSYFQLYAFIVQHLPNNNNDKVTIVGGHWIAGFSWIPNDVFSKDHDYRRFSKSTKVPTKNVLFVLDNNTNVLDNNTKDTLSKNKEISLRSLYTTSKKIATFEDINKGHYDFNKYPYTSMSENIGIGRVEIRTNY